ncbi:HD domain-containing protein [Vibrio sp. JC009]|uniref:HD-GYP domain-containing protein n=1 Tax=Vibrio sp. JC009 TaxID=2912314 RepID=UPI0023AF5FF5|nr:HD domain-containing phosphohydrolase [Vibrio sp. JC009]WED24713.1 HD domain-containing protein [Vibrio sp. JC009]
MKTFTLPEIDEDMLQDVVEETNIHCANSSTTSILLEQDPHNTSLLNELFRSVHTIKGVVAIAQVSPLLPLLMAMEDILAMIREGELSYNTQISDALLSILNEVKFFVADCAVEKSIDYDPDIYISAATWLKQVRPDNQAEHQSLFTKVTLALESSTEYEKNSAGFYEQSFDDLDIDWAKEIEPDLIFFQSIMKPVEQRLDNWEGRSDRQLKLALLLNQFAGKPVDETQLIAAVYLHDIGMALLPLALLRKTSPLKDSETTRVRGHVERAVNFLSEMPHWSEARQFIYEHHERPDGDGYPNGLGNDDISHGAKILALVDSFEAMTHERARHRHEKRSIIHALQEINHSSGTQFCPFWVETLNRVMDSILAK